MVDYAEGEGCHWQHLLTYFDDNALLAGPCYHCDNDPPVPDEAARLATLRRYAESLADPSLKGPFRP